MENVSLPTKIEYAAGQKPNQTVMTIEPLYPGYGLTIGNALRRVLLSSLPGGAVVAVKIKGVAHEFSTIPYVQEDVVDIILNLKKVRFRVHSDETVRVTLQVKGEKNVTGADIEGTSEVEIATPDAHICTLTNKNAQLEMELFVKRGRGYWPTEAREKEKLEIGTIAVDAIFTPVKMVGLDIQNVRVGQMTNYNKVVLTIETDGSVTGEEAAREASKILVDHFAALLGGVSAEATQAEEEEAPLETAVEAETEDQAAAQDEEEGEAEEGGEESAPKKRGRPKKGS